MREGSVNNCDRQSVDYEKRLIFEGFSPVYYQRLAVHSHHMCPQQAGYSFLQMLDLTTLI